LEWWTKIEVDAQTSGWNIASSTALETPCLLDKQTRVCFNRYKPRNDTNNRMASVDHFCAQLKAQGRRVTPQRRAIIQTLLEDHPHPTAEQIFTHVRQTMPDLSPATVYNTLHELVEMGTLLELDLGLGERRYDVTTADHAHLVCLRCGRVEDVPYDHEGLKPLPEHARGFQVIDQRVTFRGYCPTCASQGEDRDRTS
jgi:Fur family peroxide stress response transcriptional regulator